MKLGNHVDETGLDGADETEGADAFEQRLARLMHGTLEPAPFEPRHREQLRAGVRTRRRVRTAYRAAGSAAVVAGLGLGLLLWPHQHTQVLPRAPGSTGVCWCGPRSSPRPTPPPTPPEPAPP